VVKKLNNLDVDSNTVRVSKREAELFPFAPPGSDEIVGSK